MPQIKDDMKQQFSLSISLTGRDTFLKMPLGESADIGLEPHTILAESQTTFLYIVMTFPEIKISRMGCVHNGVTTCTMVPPSTPPFPLLQPASVPSASGSHNDHHSLFSLRKREVQMDGR